MSIRIWAQSHRITPNKVMLDPNQEPEASHYHYLTACVRHPNGGLHPTPSTPKTLQPIADSLMFSGAPKNQGASLGSGQLSVFFPHLQALPFCTHCVSKSLTFLTAKTDGHPRRPNVVPKEECHAVQGKNCGGWWCFIKGVEGLASLGSDSLTLK